jgi:hypothetical protein
MQVGSGSTSRIITDDLKTPGLDNLEYEVVGWTWGNSRQGQHELEWIE